MILIAMLILVPASSLHAGGPGDATPGLRVDSRAVGAIIRQAGPAVSPGDAAGLGECDDEGWDDDDGAGPFLDATVVTRIFRQNGATPRGCGSPMISAPSLRAPHLRC